MNFLKLMGLLYLKTPRTGYGQALVGHYPDQTYGLGLCRGDVSPWDCLGCMTQASTEAQKLCPQNKGAIIWYDYCMLKYLDQDFLGQIDNKAAVLLSNVNNVTDPTLFNQKKNELLDRLSEWSSASPKRYASGEIDVSGDTRIYGLAQCTRDLSSYDCKKCIDSEISQLTNCCEGKQGAQVLGGSCTLRYEMYPFVKL